MNSKIFTGTVMHSRLTPIKHTFSYPVYLYSFDLDELPLLDKKIFGFGHNRLRPVALHDKDYLKGGGSIKEKLMVFLKEKGCDDGIARIELVTAARYFNYVFNPVSFYYCFRADGSLRCAAAEVNNTFNETHLYLLDEPVKGKNGFLASYFTPKEFHVSPFNDMKGDYDFRFADIREKLDIRINIVKEGRPVFRSRLWGKPLPLTSANLAKTIVRYPVTASLSMPRILWQAAKLHYQKKLPVYTKPNPRSPMTFRVAPPTLIQKICRHLVFRFLNRINKGQLHMTLPDQDVRVFGDPTSPLKGEMTVINNDFFIKVVVGGDIGFAESYFKSNWSTANLSGLLKIFAVNMEWADDRQVRSAWLRRWANRLFHLVRKNHLKGSRKNIEAHYDLSNDLYRTFLDETMTYSCAVFKSDEENLEQAQRNKINAVIEKARLTAEDHVLEIGSGWGALAIEAARQTGCRVTTITLSKEQFELVQERVREAGLTDQITVKLCDYREIEGKFSKIISVEMLEAVGHEYLGKFFGVCDRLLERNGRVVLQVITIPDRRYNLYRNGCDFIQRYIFPGAVVPSMQALSAAMARHSSFIVANVENIGVHYTRTLREWREKFLTERERVQNLGFDEKFQRMWEYYFSYCEAGFTTRLLDTVQMVLTRPN